MFPYFCTVSICILLLYGLSILKKQQIIYERKLLFERYDSLMSTLDQAKDLAFKKVYQEDLLTQINSGFRINNVEVSDLGTKYVHLVIDCCGPANLRDLITYFGDIDSLTLFLMHGFVLKVVETESSLIDTAVNDSTEKEDAAEAILEQLGK